MPIEKSLQLTWNEGELEEFFVEHANEVIDEMQQKIRPKMGFNMVTHIRGCELAVLAQSYQPEGVSA